MFLGESVGMPDSGLAVMTTSSTLLSLLFGLCSRVPSVLVAPGEFSFRKDEGSLERSGSCDGVPYLPLLPFDDGVDGMGEFGKDLSTFDR